MLGHVPSTRREAEGRSKSNGTSMRSPRISVSLSKKDEGFAFRQGGEAFDLVAVGVALAEDRRLEGQDFGAEFLQQGAHGGVGDAGVAGPAGALLRFRDEETTGEAGHRRPERGAEQGRFVLQPSGLGYDDHVEPRCRPGRPSASWGAFCPGHSRSCRYRLFRALYRAVGRVAITCLRRRHSPFRSTMIRSVRQKISASRPGPARRMYSRSSSVFRHVPSRP